MIYPTPRRRPADPPVTSLLQLFEITLAPQLLPRGDETGVLSIDGGACVWVPAAKLAITTMGSDSPIEGYTHREAAELSSIDILAIDLSREGNLVECQLELFASHRTHKFAVQRLALWLSPHGLAGLVPVRPRNGYEPLPPCFALTPDGIRFLADPFFHHDEWQAGITRALEATGRNCASMRPVRPPVLRLVQ